MSQETAPGIAGMTHQESLYGKTPDQLAALCGELGMPRFAARQIARWLYVRHTEDPLRMTDIAAAHRQQQRRAAPNGSRRR